MSSKKAFSRNHRNYKYYIQSIINKIVLNQKCCVTIYMHMGKTAYLANTEPLKTTTGIVSHYAKEAACSKIDASTPISRKSGGKKNCGRTSKRDNRSLK